MADIKVKQSRKGTVKTLNKNFIKVQRFKNNLISAKNKTKETYENNYNTGTEYATNKITKTMSNAPYNIYRADRIGKNNLKQTKENLYKAHENIKKVQRKRKINKRTKNIATVKKNTAKIAKTTIKTVKKSTKVPVKATKKTIQVIRTTAKVTIQGIKTTVKATITSIKAILAGTKALVAAIVAGGWMSIVVILVICLIAMLLNSIFGIFFSSEDKTNGKNMSSVISEINNEFINEITEIQNNTTHDEYDINSNRASWEDILAVYAVNISGGEYNVELMTLSDDRIQTLKNIFWDMNTISSSTEKVTKEITIADENGNSKTEKKEQTVLHITVTSKSIEEMINLYNFNNAQQIQLVELRKEEYASMWNAVIYGTSSGSQDIVQVAKQQIGNIRADKLIGHGMDFLQE